MGEGSPGYRNIRPMMSPHNHMDLHYQQGREYLYRNMCPMMSPHNHMDLLYQQGRKYLLHLAYLYIYVPEAQ